MIGRSGFVGINHIQLAAPTDCEDAARRFYGELMGLPELEKPRALAARGGVWFQCGAQQLHIGVEPDFRPARKAHPALELVNVTTLNTLAASLELAGIPVEFDELLPGFKRFYAHDPFGNRIEFLCPLDY